MPINLDRDDENDLQLTCERYLEVASRLGQMALREPDLDSLLADMLGQVAQVLQFELCFVLELSPEREMLIFRGGAGWPDGFIGKPVMRSDLRSQAGYTLLSGTPVVVEDFSHESRFTASDLLRQHDIHSGITAIIDGVDRSFGVLGIFFRESRVFTESDIHFLQALANIIASVVMHQSQMLDNREARADAINKARDQDASARRRTVALETANLVAVDILSSRSDTEVLRHIADAARVLSGARYAALGVASEDGLTLSEFITVGLTPNEESLIGPLPNGGGVLGLLLNRRDPLRIDVLSDHPASVGFPPNHPPMKSFLGVPIRRGDIVIGSLYLTDKQEGAGFTSADEAAVQALASHAAVAIYNLQMLSRQRALVSSLINAQEEERRAVAYDLHDGLTQYVMAAHAHLESYVDMLANSHDTNDGEMKQELEWGLKYLGEAVLESRRLVNGLRLLALDDLGLAGAVEQLLQEEKSRAGWHDAVLLQNIDGERFDKALETGSYRIIQEMLTNCRKHSGTTRVKVLLQLEQQRDQKILVLEVTDWGTGFAIESRSAGPGHAGIQGIIERVRLLNGKLKIESEPGKGAILRVNFSIAPN